MGQLANLVRAFAAADVQHRILALFDNDTAAKLRSAISFWIVFPRIFRFAVTRTSLWHRTTQR